MNKSITILDKDYAHWVKELSSRYRHSQIKAAVRVNEEMLRFYWDLGHDIVINIAEKQTNDTEIAQQAVEQNTINIEGTIPNIAEIEANEYRQEELVPQFGGQRLNDLFAILRRHHKLKLTIVMTIPSIAEIEAKLSETENNREQ